MKKILFLLLCPIALLSQNIEVRGTVVNGKEFVDDVVMSIRDTGNTFFYEAILSKCEFNAKLSVDNMFVITFTKQGHIQRNVIVNTHNFPDKKLKFAFDIEMPELSTTINHKLYMTPTIYWDGEIKYKY